jgi:hypothetical protein
MRRGVRACVLSATIGVRTEQTFLHRRAQTLLHRQMVVAWTRRQCRSDRRGCMVDRKLSRRVPGLSGSIYPFFNLRSKGTIAGAAIIDFGISTGFSAVVWDLGPKSRSGKSGYRIVGYIDIPVTDVIAHGWAANHNWQFVTQCRKARLSC